MCRMMGISPQGVLNALDEVLGLKGAHGAGHVLQADGLEAHGLEFLTHGDVFFDRVHRALGVGDTAGGDGVLGRVLHRCVQCGAQVTENRSTRRRCG